MPESITLTLFTHSQFCRNSQNSNTFITDSTLTPWAVAGPHGQLASTLNLAGCSSCKSWFTLSFPSFVMIHRIVF